MTIILHYWVLFKGIDFGWVVHRCQPPQGDQKSGHSLFCTNPPQLSPNPLPTPLPHTHTYRPSPPNYDKGMYEILHEVHNSKILFHHCNDELIRAKMFQKPYSE